MRALLLCLLLTGCATTPPEVVTRVVKVPVEVYVPIDAKYTKPCEWVREAPLEQIIAVARGRKRCLQVYEADRKTISEIEGAPKP